MSYELIGIMTGSQIRAARALLRWTTNDLALRSKVSIATIKRAEALDGNIRMTLANAEALSRAFADAGVELIAENGGGVGARFLLKT